MQFEYLSLHLTILSIVIGGVTLIIAVLSFLGFYFLRRGVIDGVDKKVGEKLLQIIEDSQILAKETASTIAKIEVDKRINELKGLIVKLSTKISADDLSLGSPLHSALDSRKSEEIKEVYIDE